MARRRKRMEREVARKIRLESEDRSRLWDVAMVVLLLGSVILAFWYETLDPASDASLRRIVEWVDLGLVLFFYAEWAWRVQQSRPAAGRYAATHAWELLGMVPIILPLPAFLRALRLVRLVRILRVFGVVGKRLGVWERIAKEGNIHKIGLAAALITIVGSTLVWLLDRHDNPDLANWGEALWWGVVTVTTVGYGDITPVTPPARFVAAALMATGIGVIGLLASSLASVLVLADAPDRRGDDGSPQSPASSLAAELERLAALHQDGKLTDDEFQSAKSAVLGPTPSAAAVPPPADGP